MLIPAEQLNLLTDRDLSIVEWVVLHHTADNDQQKDIEEIAREEEASQHFTTVGYHAVIHGDGTVQFGRPIGKVPAANIGLNTVSYAISLEGNFHPPDPGYTGESPSAEQLHAFVELVDLVKHKLPNLKYLIGHRDVARIKNNANYATACPGDLAYLHLHDLRVQTKLIGK